MMNEDNLKKSLDKINIQIEATIAVLSGGRSMNGNSFDFNNLMKTKEYIESLLAANVTKTSKK
tara:strand:- start:816 stop:1004 length:189 start_codon:yes stop_codon:yes gene_type:complete